MNKHDIFSGIGAEAQIQYLDGDYRVITQGRFVRCSVTGQPIDLENLRYWSVERQEAYAGPEAVLKRMELLTRSRT